MRNPRLASLLLLLPVLPCFSACSTESGSNPSDGSFYVVSCTLGCTDGTGGEQVFCSIANTYQNLEISILFSETIDLFSVNSATFRVVDVANGTSPAGQYFSDPTNPRRLIFRPSLTFDQNGTPIFGFASATSYRILLPGEAQGDSGPYIQSITGRNNQSRLQCTIKTTEGVIDPVPGPPSVQIFVDQVVGYQPDGTPIIVSDVLANGGTELNSIYRLTDIRFEFNDVMNVATLLDPTTGTAPFISVEVDEDGDLATQDRTAIEGTFSYAVDLERLETTLTFTLDVALPSAGPNAPANPRRIVLTLPSGVKDLVANSLSSGGGTQSFVPELPTLGEVLLPDGGEDFLLSSPDPASHEDGPRSGAFWGGGRLIAGIGGGSGRLGDLFIPAGVTVILNTDSQTFPLGPADGFGFTQQADLIGNPDPTSFPNTLGNFPDSITVTDGVFEFNSLVLRSGSELRLEGTQPARIYVRGTTTLETGTRVLLNGVDAGLHDSSIIDPETTVPLQLNAAGGADGGFGADRFDMDVNPAMGGLAKCESDAISNPGADTSGRAGMGVGRSAGQGGGLGGVQYPTNYPTVNLNTTADNNNQGLGFNRVNDYNVQGVGLECRSLMVGGVGSGGAYALDGGIGTSDAVTAFAEDPAGQDNGAPDTPGGDSTQIGIEPAAEDNVGYVQRLLTWSNGFLRGGSGGGGGGNHPHGSFVFDTLGGSLCIGAGTNFVTWHDHSGAQGGYGGGALQLTSGKQITVNGSIQAQGGKGGEARAPLSPFMCDAVDWTVDFGQFATPGGGGSGGAIKLQSMVVNLASQPGTLDVSGGLGGAGIWSLSQGGQGSPGLVRIEDVAGSISRALLAPSILPYDPTDNSLSWLSVDRGQDPVDGPGWAFSPSRPDSISASSSCWLVPNGLYFALSFLSDEADENTGDPNKMGWNMDVLYTPGGGPEVTVPFRGANAFFAGSWENEFGKSLGTQGGTVSAAPIVVRFQGARTDGTTDLCNADLNDPNSGIVAGSVTPWVDHPALLNNFGATPSMIRFVVIFDGTNDTGDTPGAILADVAGLTNMRVRVIPD